MNVLELSGQSRIRALIDENPLWLAPMAGVNDSCFRSICKTKGAGVTYTEMISATGLYYNFDSETSQRLLSIADNEQPVAVQLFGANPEIVSNQARVVAEHLGERLAFIDINMGCPVTKVVRKGEGSALMLNRHLAAEIVSRTVEALRVLGQNGSDIPVTVKFRRGFGNQEDTAVEFGRAMETAGASALAVHGRFQAQYYKGEADAATVSRVKNSVTVPVIGTGDVLDAQSAVKMITATKLGGFGADAVMIARGAQGNPWIFDQARQLRESLLAQQPQNIGAVNGILDSWISQKPSYEEIFEIMLDHAQKIESTFGTRSLVRMRKHATWYCAGLPGASYFRRHMNNLTSMADLESLICEYRNFLVADE